MVTNKLTQIGIGLASSIVIFGSVAGTAFAQTTPTYNQGLAQWAYIENAKCFRIYYKEKGAADWQFAVHCRDLKNPTWKYTIGYLKKGVNYTYRVQAVNFDSSTYWVTGEQTLKISTQK